MKNFLMLMLLFVLMLACSEQKLNFASFKNTQDYTVPLFKDSSANKIALFIFPHPDDEVVCGGAIAQLKKEGWQINLLTLTQGSASEKNQRKEEWTNAVREFGFDHSELLDLPNNPWDSIVSDQIEFWYDHTDSIEKLIFNSIVKYKPSLVFTYDTVLGAYGHPEHRITAAITGRIFKQHQSDSSFSVQRLLQITLPEKMEQLMLANAESYKNAIARTGNKTLPEPSTAFDVLPYWPVKRKAASLYTSQAGTLRKFYLLPDEEDTTVHFNSFDREYYFEVRKK